MSASISLSTNASRSAMKQVQKSAKTSNTVAEELVTTADFGLEPAELVAGDKEELTPTSTREPKRLSKPQAGQRNGDTLVADGHTEEDTLISVTTCPWNNAKLHATKLAKVFATILNSVEATSEVLAEHGLANVVKLNGSTQISMSDLVQQSTKLATAQRKHPNASQPQTEPSMPNTTVGTSEEETSEARL